MSGSMQSNVGNRQVYEANEQKDDSDNVKRFEEGTENSHNNLDSTSTEDSRSLANKLASQSKADQEPEPKSLQKQRLDQDATLPARAQGHEPSRGAKIDQEIREEEEEMLSRKGI